MELARKTIIVQLFYFLLFSGVVSGQNFTRNVWCFGDSSRLDFTQQGLTVASSGVNSVGSSGSICDSTSEIILYANVWDAHIYSTGQPALTTIRNRFDVPIEGGDTLKGGAWYEDLLLIPKPVHIDEYYVITAGGSFHLYGIYYNLVDMSLNSGLGKNVQRNVQYDTLPISDGISAIKHGNGRDWWMIYRYYDPNSILNPNNSFYVVRIDSNGFSTPNIQNIGPVTSSDLGSISFSSDGVFFVWSDLSGIITKYDFDRCSGIISNPIVIDTARSHGPYPEYISNALSASDRYLYVSSYNEVNNDTNYIFQYDLIATNISASKTLVGTFPIPEGAGKIKLASDNKIYIASLYECPWGYCFPFPDSVHNYITDNLSVINQPDSPGVACDLQKFSVYLGGRRTYGCLPNNPNYALGPLVGSGCDTLSTGVALGQEPGAQLFVTYESNWKKIFVNAQRLKGRQCRLSVYDVNGKLIDGDVQESYQGYYTKSMEMGGYGAGVYLLRLETEKEVLTTKFVVP